MVLKLPNDVSAFLHSSPNSNVHFFLLKPAKRGAFLPPQDIPLNLMFLICTLESFQVDLEASFTNRAQGKGRDVDLSAPRLF